MFLICLCRACVRVEFLIIVLTFRSSPVCVLLAFVVVICRRSNGNADNAISVTKTTIVWHHWIAVVRVCDSSEYGWYTNDNNDNRKNISQQMPFSGKGGSMESVRVSVFVRIWLDTDINKVIFNIAGCVLFSQGYIWFFTRGFVCTSHIHRSLEKTRQKPLKFIAVAVKSPEVLFRLVTFIEFKSKVLSNTDTNNTYMYVLEAGSLFTALSLWLRSLRMAIRHAIHECAFVFLVHNILFDTRTILFNIGNFATFANFISCYLYDNFDCSAFRLLQMCFKS